MEHELERAGVAAETTRALTDVLRACEDARFSPAGVDVGAAQGTWERAKKALAPLEMAA
jgi:hypothetical protein